MSSSTRSKCAEVVTMRADPHTVATLVLAALLAVAAHVPTSVASTLPVTPDHVRRHIDDARPSGSGRLTWFGFHVYDARMFVPRNFNPANPSAQPFALEITYARSLEGRAIAERSRDEIARLGLGSDAQRQRWLADMVALFPDVKSGQQLVGIYRPGSSTRFYVDGGFLGEVADPEFGRAFFAIWLDPRTSAPQLRASLLSAPR